MPAGAAKQSSLTTALLGAWLALALSACTIRGPASLSASGSKTSTTTISSSTVSSALNLSKVLRSQADPAGKFDLIGDGSGAFQSFCNPTNATIDPTQANQTITCQCAYSYVDALGNNLSISANPTHIESDLIRCPFTDLPGETTQAEVRVHFLPADLVSNAVVFSFSSASGGASLSDISAFVKPVRFQCKNHVFISHMGDNGGGAAGTAGSPTTVYDPIQSEDPSLAYGFNFYTSNPGGAVALYASQTPAQQRLWECPLDLTSASRLGLDLTLFSRMSDGVSSQISPPTVGTPFDRSTFWLARKKTGIFNVAVNAPLMPGLANSLPGADGSVTAGTAPVLGFGVAPSASASNELCPGSSVTIPTGYHWAKLWLFRASLPVRYALDSPRIRNTAVSCNPGKYKQIPGAPLFSDCASNNAGATSYSSNFGSGLDDWNGTSFNGSQLVDRILILPQASTTEWAQRCYKLGLGANSSLAAGGTSSATGLLPGYTQYPLGADLWFPRDTNASSLNVCSNPERYDVLNLCSTPTATGEDPATPSNVPHEAGTTDLPLKPTALDIDNGSGYSSRYDYVFVVTPTTVSTRDMKGEGADPDLGKIYSPYRFIPASACASGDPDNDPACKPEFKRNYELKLHDIAINSDDPTNNGSNRNVNFPVCVLQPN